MADLKSIIAKNIVTLRQSAKMTQSDLAEQLNYSDKAISKWERGESVPDVLTMADMAGKLAVQFTSDWKTPTQTTGITLEEAFATWKFSAIDPENQTVDEIKENFYTKYIQKQLLPYVSMGQFVKRTSNLFAYGRGQNTMIIQAQELQEIAQTAGATEDTHIVHLEKNIPQRIRMFIWLEGQDVDCVNVNQVLDLALSIEFAGGSN